MADEAGGGVAGQARCRDVERAPRGFAQYRNGVGGGTEGYAEGSMRVDSEAWPTARIQIGVTVHDQQRHLVQAV
jgi:hypothetical protein